VARQRAWRWIKGIRGNVIAPGFIDSPIDRGASPRRADSAPTAPFGHQGAGLEVACAARFLISNESCYACAYVRRFPAPAVSPGSGAARLRKPNGFRDCENCPQCPTLPYHH